MAEPLTPAEAARLRRLQIRAFGLTWLSYASYYLVRKNVSVVKSTLTDTLGITVGQLGAMDTFYLAAYALGQFVNGALGDRLGARRVIGLGMLASAAAAFVMGMSGTALVFITVFGLNGFFQSTGWPNNVKAMQPWFPARTRGKIMGFWCTNYQVGGLVATALATFLMVTFGWRWAFFVPGTWVAMVGGAILLFLVERPQDKGLPPVEDSDAPDPAGAIPDAPPAEEPKVAFFQMLRMPAVWSLGGAY